MNCAKCGKQTMNAQILTAPFVYFSKKSGKMQGFPICSSCFPVVEEIIRRGEQPTFLKPPDAEKNILDEP